MAATGPKPLTFKYGADKDYGFDLIPGSKQITPLIDQARIARLSPELRGLANLLNEMNTRVNTVVNQFHDIALIKDSLSKENAPELYDSVRPFYRPISMIYDLATKYYLSEDEFDRIFKDSEIHKASAIFLKEIFETATAPLKGYDDVANFVNVLENLTVSLERLIPLYLQAIENATNLATEHNRLNPGVKSRVESYLIDKGLPTLSGLNGLEVTGPQHIGRIPLVLGELAKKAIESSEPYIKAQGEKLAKILADIKTTMQQKYATPKLKP